MKEETMKGYIDECRMCRAKVTVIGGRQTIVIDAVVDSGFNGDICLPAQTAIQLGLELCGLQRVELADGAKKRELIFAGEVVFNGEQKWVEIFLTDSEDTLIGAGLLAGHVVTIDYVERTLEIMQKEQPC
jgi:clan AA aspartic protease